MRLRSLVTLCGGAGIRDAGRYSDGDIDSARDGSVLRAAAAAELHDHSAEERRGGANHRGDGAAHVL